MVIFAVACAIAVLNYVCIMQTILSMIPISIVLIIPNVHICGAILLEPYCLHMIFFA